MKSILLTLLLLSPLAFADVVNLACESTSEFEIQLTKPDTKFESVTIYPQTSEIVIGTETYDYLGEGNAIKYFHDYGLGSNRQGTLDRYTGQPIDSIFDSKELKDQVKILKDFVCLIKVY